MELSSASKYVSRKIRASSLIAAFGFCSEDSDDDDDDDDAEAPTLSPEERAARTAALVAPLAEADWGHKPAPAAAPATPALERPAREPKLTRNVYEGASDDDDSSEGEDEGAPPKGGEDGEYEGVDEDDPAVLGEPDLDLEEEMDEFLRFATETLGLSKEQYQGILGEREKRGGEGIRVWDYSFSPRCGC